MLAVKDVSELVAATAVNEFVAFKLWVENAEDEANNPFTEMLAV
jgi:hypothetical protein